MQFRDAAMLSYLNRSTDLTNTHTNVYTCHIANSVKRYYFLRKTVQCFGTSGGIRGYSRLLQIDHFGAPHYYVKMASMYEQ